MRHWVNFILLLWLVFVFLSVSLYIFQVNRFCERGVLYTWGDNSFGKLYVFYSFLTFTKVSWVMQSKMIIFQCE
jgi:hypothetical protein